MAENKTFINSENQTGLVDDGGLMGGRWVFTFLHRGAEKPILLKEEGPFYDYENWPESCRPASYRLSSPAQTVTLGDSPSKD
jgi:hypothetical protein